MFFDFCVKSLHFKLCRTVIINERMTYAPTSLFKGDEIVLCHKWCIIFSKYLKLLKLFFACLLCKNRQWTGTGLPDIFYQPLLQLHLLQNEFFPTWQSRQTEDNIYVYSRGQHVTNVCSCLGLSKVLCMSYCNTSCTQWNYYYYSFRLDTKRARIPILKMTSLYFNSW